MTLKNNTKTILKEKTGKRQPIKTNKQKRYFFYKRNGRNSINNHDVVTRNAFSLQP